MEWVSANQHFYARIWVIDDCCVYWLLRGCPFDQKVLGIHHEWFECSFGFLAMRSVSTLFFSIQILNWCEWTTVPADAHEVIDNDLIQRAQPQFSYYVSWNFSFLTRKVLKCLLGVYSFTQQIYQLIHRLHSPSQMCLYTYLSGYMLSCLGKLCSCTHLTI